MPNQPTKFRNLKCINDGISDRLRYLREQLLQITQAEMAHLIGVSISTYTKIEGGISMCSVKTCRLAAKTLGVPLGWLQCGSGHQPKMLNLTAIEQNKLRQPQKTCPISQRQISRIIELASDPKLCAIANEIATMTQSDELTSLANVIYQKLKQKPFPNNNQ